MSIPYSSFPGFHLLLVIRPAPGKQALLRNSHGLFYRVSKDLPVQTAS